MIENSDTILVFIDIRQAFPSVNFEALRNHLYNLSIRNTELQWFTSCMYNMRHST